MRRKAGSKLRWGFAWVLVLVVVATFLIRQSHVISVRRRLSLLKQDIEYYTAANVALEKQIEALKSDEYIEKVAREKLGLVRPGEIQYIPVEHSEKR